MKNFFSLFTVFALGAVLAVPAQAGAFGSSILQITNARLQRSNTEVGGYVDATFADISVSSAGNTSSTRAFLAPNLLDTKSGIGTLDALQSYVSVPGLLPPAENMFSSFGNPLSSSYSRGDTNGIGSLIGGATVQSLSETSSITNTLTGTASGQVVGNGIFEVTVLRGGYYRLIFDAQLDMQAVSSGLLVGKSTSDFRTQINGGNLAFVNDALATLNRSISGNSVVGVLTTGIASTGILLDDFSLNTFNIRQVTTSSVSTIPEPGSIAVFGIIGLVAFVGRRRISSSKA